MSNRSTGFDWHTAGYVALALLLAVMFLGHLVGQPAVLGYVETDSMSPTLEAGDGFVAIPAFLSPGVSEGDVVVYEAEAIEGGGLTTHRVVGETDEGYVTRGDANPFTDQDSGEPHVTRDRVRAKALQVAGGVVVVPGIGHAVEAVQSAAGGVVTYVAESAGLGSGAGSQVGGLALVAFGVLLFASSALGERRRSRSRERRVDGGPVDGRAVALALLLLVLVPANYAMLGAANVHQFPRGEVTGEADSASGSVEHRMQATNTGLVAMLVVLESHGEGVAVEPSSMTVASGGSETASVDVEPRGDAAGEGTAMVEEHRYFVLLPPPLLESLHRKHPAFAVTAVNAVLGFGVLGLVGGLFGFGKLRFRDTSRQIPLSTRIKREIRRL